MSWIRKYPFGNEDALEIMLEYVSREAEVRGHPLTSDETALLRSETFDPNVDPNTESRLLELVESIVEREAAEVGSDNYKIRNFSNAIEWAGDMQYPYIVHLAEHVITGRPSTRSTRKGRIWGLIRLFATGFAIVLVMLLVVSVIGILSEKH
jgi:hypothetical protein